MIEGRKLVPIMAVIILGGAAFSVTTVLRRQTGASSAFVDQMRTDARCNILAAPDSGVRRQAMLALLELHPEWGFDVKDVEARSMRVELAGTGELPPGLGGERRGWVELGWQVEGEPEARIDGLRALCVAEHVVSAVPIQLSLGGERLRSQGTILLPPKMGAYPAAAEPVTVAGPEADAVRWRVRCAPAGEGGRTACAVDAFDEAVPGWFTPTLSYLSAEIAPSPGAATYTERRLLGGEVGGGQVGLTFQVTHTRARLTGDCPTDKVWIGPHKVEDPGCKVEATTVEAVCACGSWPAAHPAQAAPVTCAPRIGGEEAAALCEAIPLAGRGV